jgi:hypothetical protein
MADSTTHLDVISGSQLQKEVTANELFDAMSIASLYGRRASKCSALTWGFYGGRYRETNITGGTRSLQASATNYMVADRLTGGATFSTDATNWNDDDNYMRLYKVVTDGLGVTSYEDHRSLHDRVLA